MKPPALRSAHRRVLGIVVALPLALAPGADGLPPPPPTPSGAVALETADPPCANDSGAIYVDCGNGTVTDNRTGLVWLADADCLTVALTWQDAMEFVAGLADEPVGSTAKASDCGLADNSSAGDWRLPSVAEWEAMVRDGVFLGCDPVITVDAGDACWYEGCVGDNLCSFSNVVADFLWSGTTAVTVLGSAWTIDLEFGFTGFGDKTNLRWVWPVRGQ